MEQLYFYLWYLLIYACLGWCAEVAYAAVKLKKFVNRGFLNGPVCPIYGFGVCIVVFCLTPIQNRLPILFIGAVNLTSALEFLTGYVLDKVYHEHWWDYSNQPLNLKGYICLSFSLLWGVACVAVVRLVHPAVSAVVAWMPRWLGLPLLFVFLDILLIDFASTVENLRRFRKAMKMVETVSGKLKEFSDDVGSGISGKVLQTMEKGKELKVGVEDFRAEKRDQYLQNKSELLLDLYALLSRTEPGRKRIFKAYPNLKRAAAARQAEEYKKLLRDWLQRRGERNKD